MESRFKLFAVRVHRQPYRRESPYTVAQKKEEGAGGGSKKRTKQKKKKNTKKKTKIGRLARARALRRCTVPLRCGGKEGPR